MSQLTVLRQLEDVMVAKGQAYLSRCPTLEMGKPGFDSATWDLLVIRTDKGLNDLTKLLKASTQDEIVDLLCNQLKEIA